MWAWNGVWFIIIHFQDNWLNYLCSWFNPLANKLFFLSFWTCSQRLQMACRDSVNSATYRKNRSSLLVLQIVLHGLNTDIFKMMINSSMSLICINSFTKWSLFLSVLVTLITVMFSVQWDQNKGFYNFFPKSFSIFFFQFKFPSWQVLSQYAHKPPHSRGKSGESEPRFSAVQLHFHAAQVVCCLSFVVPVLSHLRDFTQRSSRDDQQDQFLPFKWLHPSLFSFPGWQYNMRAADT